MKRLIQLFEKPLLYYPVIWLVVIFSLGYWAYLYFSTEMVIAHDAIGYENAGRQIFEGGWKAYFENGPQREPLYLLSIAFSMKLGQVFSLDYQHFQKLFQVFLLFSTQLFLLYLLGKLRVHNFLKVLTTLYFGVSPALVNAAYSLYSEIIVYPFVLLAVILLVKSWQGLFEKNLKQIIFLGLLTGACILVLSLGKGIFRLISIACYLPFLSAFVRFGWRKNWDGLKKTGAFIVTSMIIFNFGIIGVKLLNKQYNGEYTFTGKYNFIILSSAMKRARPLTKDIVFAHIASIPGTGVCLKFYSPEQCRYADWFGAIDTTVGERADMLEAFPDQEKNKAMMYLAFMKILEHPVQYTLFSVIEVGKLLFWESTRVGYVRYPPWLTRLFTAGWFRYGVRLLTSTLTIFGYFFLWFYCMRVRHRFFEPSAQHEKERTVFFIFLITTLFMGVYALCYALTRYALPIASLHLLSIALFFDFVFKRTQGANKANSP